MCCMHTPTHAHQRKLDNTLPNNGTLLQFKAGRMNHTEKIVVPDERKGVILIRQDESFDLHFCWMDRRAGAVELDVLVQPGTVEFRRIESCRTGRIYMLKFRRTSRRMFFWMQDPRYELDDAICARVNELLRSNDDDQLMTPDEQQPRRSRDKTIYDQ